MTLKSNKVRSVNFLINKLSAQHPELQIPYTGLFVGAGCSVYAGIPTAGGIINMCKQKAFLMEIDLEEEDEELKDVDKVSRRQDAYDAWILGREDHLRNEILTANPTFSQEELDSKFWDNLYSYWFMQFSENDKDRHRLIESVIEKTEPKGPYIFLAYLIEKGVFKNIFTTNFDDLLNDAITFYTTVRTRMYHSDDLSQYISFTSKTPNIVKLHGDFRFGNMKNTVKETAYLDINYSSKLMDYLSHFDLLVVGYNGGDKSIMDVLEKAKEERPYGLYWCVRKLDEVHPRVKKLINNTDNSYLFEITDFSTLIMHLHTKFGKKQDNEDTIMKVAKRRFEKQMDFERVLREKIVASQNISTEVKDKFGETLDINELFNQAFMLPDEKSSEMIDIYNRVLKIKPSYWQAYYNRGLAKNNLKEFDAAIEDFNKALKIAPEVSNTYLAKGYAYSETNKFEDALRCYNDAIKFDENNAIAHYNKATAISKLSEIKDDVDLQKDAINAFDMSISLDSNYADAYVGRGYSKTSLKRYEQSIEDYNKALKIDSNLLLALSNRAHSYSELGETDKALADYDKIIRIDSNNFEAYNNRGYVKTKLKNFEAAMKDVDKAFKLSPENSYVNASKAELYGHMGKDDLFYQWLEKALKLGYPLAQEIGEEDVYQKHQNDKRFKDLLKKYKVVLKGKEVVV